MNKKNPHPLSYGITRRALVWSAGLTSLARLPHALAQVAAYPSKTVKIVVPSSPGGSLDAVSRVIALKLGELWRQSVVVENKPGANFAIGASFVAKSPADGYTLLYAHDGVMAMNPVLYPKLSYDPLTELTPVGRVVDLPYVMYVSKSLQYRTLADFLQAMKASPGKFNHASGGTATMITSELFKAVTGLQYTDVPYKGGGPAVLAVAAGEADFTFADPGSAAPLLQTDRIRGFATASPNRLRLQPNLPSISETVPAFAVTSWSGLHAPAGTPPAIIQKINADMRTIMAQQDVRQRIDALGIEINPSTPEELAVQIRNDFQKWGKLVKDKNIVVP